MTNHLQDNEFSSCNNHQFLKVSEESRPRVHAITVCVMCGQVREIFKDGMVLIKKTVGKVRIDDPITFPTQEAEPLP
jgi:Fe2+ or Zn2+ uptake regulation protein